VTPCRGSRPSFDTPLSNTLRPFRQFVIKLRGKCNLSCTFCYVFESPDTNVIALTPQVLGTLLGHRVGVSLGGTAEAHDSRRAHADGPGSRRITADLVPC
jgi:sulfatase maturation enzyme AslB (radical SAM superfamily)